jgi:hypothetical protein
MLIGELPDLRETQSGKDLIQIGKEEGKVEGKIEGEQDALILVWETKFGPLAPDIHQRIEQVKSVERLRDLLRQVTQVDAPDKIRW